MFNAIGQFLTAMFTVFSALDKGAKSIEHLAGIAEAEAQGLAEQMAVEREARLNTIIKQLKAA